MKLGFICPNLPGHFNPMTALTRNFRCATMTLSSFIHQVLPAYHLFLAPRSAYENGI